MNTFLKKSKYYLALGLAGVMVFSSLMTMAIPSPHAKAYNNDGCPDNQINDGGDCRPIISKPSSGGCPPRTSDVPNHSGLCWGPVIGKAGPAGTGGGVNPGSCPGIVSPGYKLDCSTIPAGCPGSSINGPFSPTASVTCPYDPTDANWKCLLKSCTFNSGLSVTNGQTFAAAQAAAGNANNSTSKTGCELNGDVLTWIICPVIDLLEQGIQLIDNFITSALTFDVNGVFSTSKTNGYYIAWNSFRVLATVILVISGLVIVTSQALGFEFLDAYTMKKSLPRLLVATIGISLSWPLMKFAIGFFNILGQDVRGLIYSPFSALHGTLGASTLFVFATGFGYLFATLGPAILTFLLTAMLAVIVGFLIIMVRYLAILVLIVFAPVAIACYVLPNTQKVWNLWRENFIGMLLVYPIISAFIAIGHVFSAVSLAGNGPGTFLSGTAMQAIGFIAYFLPYFLLPIAFRMATGVIGSLAGFVNDTHKGAFDGLKGFRQKRSEENKAAYKQGFDRTRLGSALKQGRQTSLARRAATGSGALPGSSRRRAEMESAEMGHLAHAAAEAIKNNPSAAANDDANKIARSAKSQSDFLEKWVSSRTTSASSQADKDNARREGMGHLASLEQAYGAKMGSHQMRHTAGTAAFSSSAAQDDIFELQSAMQEAVSNHVMTASQVASSIKASGSLASSAGFADLLNASTGKIGGAELLDAASRGFNPQMSGRMRKGQAKQLGEHMALQASLAASGFGTTSTEFATTTADSAGIHDGINAMTPDVREEFAKALNGRVVAGKRMREWETEMETTGNNAYLDRRKTWNTAAAAAGLPGGGGSGGTGGGGSSGP